MRPEILYPLFADIATLPGIGPRNRPLVERLAGPHVGDLGWHLPTSVIDRRPRPSIAAAPEGAVATLTVRVDEHRAAPNRRVPYRVVCSDGTGTLTLVFFHAQPDYLARQLPVGSERIVSGRIDRYQDQVQMTHPDYILAPEEAAGLPTIEPVYPMTQGLSPKTLRKAIAAALDRTPDLPDWLDPALKDREGWTGWREALLAAHAPQSAGDLEPTAPARRRLAYDELLANQLALALVRERARRGKGRVLTGDGGLVAKVRAALPYTLTGDQETALSEIVADMAADHAMLRLVQGDVGSGKTVVALIAMLTAVEAGTQAALLAPTEILARQHHQAIAPLAQAAGVEVALLTGRMKGKTRAALLERLAAGDIHILIGTHALIQEDVAYRDLGMAVVDEQHRFGVYQRLALAQKGAAGVDVLVMTATPIPRTLTLTAYGDMDVSRIVEKPPGRKPVDTRVVSLDRLADVVDGIARVLAQGARVYWVCPLVEESEAVDLAAVEDRHAQLKQRFGDTAGLVHGRMKGPEKDAVMADFAAGRVQLLVATTVIEVGVDVPEATVMVVEHADRFGLAQLHQLRGRVGRGDKPSSCLLLRSPAAGEAARARLNIMRETDDGFRIAEEDLRLRGAGELLGTRQSGLPEFHIADLAVHADLLAIARDDAALIVQTDPELTTDRGHRLRPLLYLFERDAAVKYLKSG